MEVHFGNDSVIAKPVDVPKPSILPALLFIGGAAAVTVALHYNSKLPGADEQAQMKFDHNQSLKEMKEGKGKKKGKAKVTSGTQNRLMPLPDEAPGKQTTLFTAEETTPEPALPATEEKCQFHYRGGLCANSMLETPLCTGIDDCPYWHSEKEKEAIDIEAIGKKAFKDLTQKQLIELYEKQLKTKGVDYEINQSAILLEINRRRIEAGAEEGMSADEIAKVDAFIDRKEKGEDEPVTFIRDSRNSMSGREMFEVDVGLLDLAWKKDKDYYLGKGEGGRKPTGEIVAPIVDLQKNGAISFTDGRHRFAALRDHGHETVTVMIRKKQVPDFVMNFSPERRAIMPKGMLLETCELCGKEYPADQDFCPECNPYSKGVYKIGDIILYTNPTTGEQFKGMILDIKQSDKRDRLEVNFPDLLSVGDTQGVWSDQVELIKRPDDSVKEYGKWVEENYPEGGEVDFEMLLKFLDNYDADSKDERVVVIYGTNLDKFRVFSDQEQVSNWWKRERDKADYSPVVDKLKYWTGPKGALSGDVAGAILIAPEYIKELKAAIRGRNDRLGALKEAYGQLGEEKPLDKELREQFAHLSDGQLWDRMKRAPDFGYDDEEYDYWRRMKAREQERADQLGISVEKIKELMEPWGKENADKRFPYHYALTKLIYIPEDTRKFLIEFWNRNPLLREGCLDKYGWDPIRDEREYWIKGLDENEHFDVQQEVRKRGFTLDLAKKWAEQEEGIAKPTVETINDLYKLVNSIQAAAYSDKGQWIEWTWIEDDTNKLGKMIADFERKAEHADLEYSIDRTFGGRATIRAVKPHITRKNLEKKQKPVSSDLLAYEINEAKRKADELEEIADELEELNDGLKPVKTEGSPARSPAGRIRNIAQMNDKKLEGLYKQMLHWEYRDPEAEEILDAELKKRGMWPYGKGQSSLGDKKKSEIEEETATLDDEHTRENVDWLIEHSGLSDAEILAKKEEYTKLGLTLEGVDKLIYERVKARTPTLGDVDEDEEEIICPGCELPFTEDYCPRCSATTYGEQCPVCDDNTFEHVFKSGHKLTSCYSCDWGINTTTKEDVEEYRRHSGPNIMQVSEMMPGGYWFERGSEGFWQCGLEEGMGNDLFVGDEIHDEVYAKALAKAIIERGKPDGRYTFKDNFGTYTAEVLMTEGMLEGEVIGDMKFNAYHPWNSNYYRFKYRTTAKKEDGELEVKVHDFSKKGFSKGPTAKPDTAVKPDEFQFRNFTPFTWYDVEPMDKDEAMKIARQSFGMDEEAPDEDWGELKSQQGTGKVVEPYFKWMGSKRRLVYDYEEAGLLPKEIKDGFLEPLAGSIAVLLYMQSQGRLGGRKIIGDENPYLITTLEVIRDNPQGLEKALSRIEEYYNPIPMGTNDDEADRRRSWHEQDSKYAMFKWFRESLTADYGTTDAVSTAATLIFIIQAGFNGLLRFNKDLECNTPFGKKKSLKFSGKRALMPGAVNDLYEMSKALQGVEIIQQDYLDTAAMAEPGDFVFLDPPYWPASETANFRQYYRTKWEQEDFERLADVVEEIASNGVLVLFANADLPEVRQLYGFLPTVVQFDVKRLGSSKGETRGIPVSEVAMANYEPHTFRYLGVR